jgi:hypothetical protein
MPHFSRFLREVGLLIFGLLFLVLTHLLRQNIDRN